MRAALAPATVLPDEPRQPGEAGYALAQITKPIRRRIRGRPNGQLCFDDSLFRLGVRHTERHQRKHYPAGKIRLAWAFPAGKGTLPDSRMLESSVDGQSSPVPGIGDGT
jgi:hypothetical protein